MKLLRWAFAWVCLIGCVDTHAIDAVHSAKVSRESERYQGDKRYSSCDAAPAGASCGLLFDKVRREEFLSSACGLGPTEAIDRKSVV